MANSNSRPDEFSLIAELFAPLSGEGAFGLKDDAAVISPSAGHELVVTADTILESIDFFPHDPADTIARKALRVNLSDLAAKGARPRAYLLSLSLTAKIDLDWLKGFVSGLQQDQAEFRISLLGGDTSATPGPLSIAVTAFGEVLAGRMIRRNGARDGDLVYVTGTIGDSGGGLSILKGEPASGADDLVQRYRIPMPRVSFGPAIAGLATSALDVSDGLIADAGHIAETSGLGIIIDADRIPLSESLRALWDENAAVRAATCGDDYEILFTASPDRDSEVRSVAEKTGTPVTRIGHVAPGAGVVLLDKNAQEIAVSRPGYRHF